nr:hypothetical protein [Tanacetum cinerariifolium]
MRTRSSSNLPVVSPNPTTSNPKRRNRIRSKQPFILGESPIDTMADQRTMAELLRAPTEGYAEAIVVPSILAEQFELKHSLINMMTSDQSFGLEKDNPHDHIHWFNKIIPPSNTRMCQILQSSFFFFRSLSQGQPTGAAVNYNQGNSVYRPPGSGSLPSNTVANPKGELKGITTRSGRVLDGPTIPTPPPFIHLEEDERVEETLTDPDLAEYTIKVPPPPVQKYKPPSKRDYIVYQRDPLHPNILYPSRMLKQKQQEKDEYHKMLKAILSNKEKLQELENTSLNENCSAAILNKLLEKLGDPGKFFISYGFSELKCKALADLGANINLIPLSVWKKLGLPELISTRMTLKLSNRAICTPAEIARDLFVPIGKFTFPADFVIVDYESDPRVPLILGIPFLRTARALIDPSGNPTFLSHPELTLPEVKDDIFDSEEGNVLPGKLLHLDSTKDLHPPLHVNPLSGSTTYSSSPNPLHEELGDELALITFPPKYNDDLQFDIESDLKDIEFLLHRDIDSSLKDSINQNDPNDQTFNKSSSVFSWK